MLPTGALALTLLASAAAAASQEPAAPTSEPPAGASETTQPAAPSVEEAERRDAAAAAFRAGEAAYRERDYAAAAAAFAEAQRLVPHPATLFNLALAREQAGDDVGAWEAYQALVQLRSGADQADARDRAALADRLAAIERRIARVDLVLPAAAARPWVCLDGQPWPETLGPARIVTPGRHVLQVERRQVSLQLRPGERRVVDLQLATELAGTSANGRATRRFAAFTAIVAAGATAAGIGAAVVADDRTERGLGVAAASAGGLALGGAIGAWVAARRDHGLGARPRKPPGATVTRCDLVLGPLGPAGALDDEPLAPAAASPVTPTTDTSGSDE